MSEAKRNKQAVGFDGVDNNIGGQSQLVSPGGFIAHTHTFPFLSLLRGVIFKKNFSNCILPPSCVI